MRTRCGPQCASAMAIRTLASSAFFGSSRLPADGVTFQGHGLAKVRRLFVRGQMVHVQLQKSQCGVRSPLWKHAAPLENGPRKSRSRIPPERFVVESNPFIRRQAHRPFPLRRKHRKAATRSPKTNRAKTRFPDVSAGADEPPARLVSIRLCTHALASSSNSSMGAWQASFAGIAQTEPHHAGERPNRVARHRACRRNRV